MSRAGASLVPVIAAAALISACGSSKSSSGGTAGSGGGSSSGGTVELKVGVPEALTGDEAFAGVEETNAMKLAASQVNSGQVGIHGVKVSLEVKDYQSVPAKGVQVVSQMLADHSINAFSGITSGGDGDAVKPIISKDDRPFTLIQATGTPLTCGVKTLWSMSPNLDPGFAMFGPYLKSHHVTSLGIMYDQQSVPQVSDNKSMKAAMAKAGISVPADVATTTAQTDFSSAVSAVTRNNPDAVFVDATAAAALMTRQLRQSGYKGLIVAQASAAGPTFSDTAGPAAAGVVFLSFWVPTQLPTALARQYVPAYTKAYKKAPDYFATNGYDSILHLARAAAKAHSNDADKLQSAMESLGTVTGALGRYRFDAGDRIPNLPFHLYKWNSARTGAPVVATMPGGVSACSS